MERGAGRLRLVLLQLLDLAGTPRPLSGRPVRAPGASAPRQRPRVAAGAGASGGGEGLRALLLAGPRLERDGSAFLRGAGRAPDEGLADLARGGRRARP